MASTRESEFLGWLKYSQLSRRSLFLGISFNWLKDLGVYMVQEQKEGICERQN
jgi:hypothetical protein